MAPLKEKGDLAELKVAADLADRGYGTAWPHGENCDFDLIAYRGDELHRVQVKHTQSDGRVILAPTRSVSLTRGRVKQIKRYTAATIDWLAVWDRTVDRCFYVPAAELGNGMDVISLRLAPTRNNQRARIRHARDYLSFGGGRPAPEGLV